MAKRMMMQQEAQGWDYTDKLVCDACVDDYALKNAIMSASSTKERCSFCGNTPAASLDVLLDAFVAGVRNEYNDADAEFIPYETREGGYQFYAGGGLDSWDLVGEFEEVFIGEGLVEEVRTSLREAIWVERNYAWRRRDDVLRDAWTAFREAVMYHTRYVIWLVEEVDEREARGYGEIPTGKVLSDVGRLLDHLGAVRALPSGSATWRAQTHYGPSLQPGPSASRLGTGKREHAKQPNRMSPAGIPMFYGSLELPTALAEVGVRVDEERDHVTAGKFLLSDEVTVVDLTSLPDVPSIFDPTLGEYRREITFLHEFVASLSTPATPGDEAIDYVPTQVLTEFLIRVFKPNHGTNPAGIIYPSAARPGGTSVVLDIPNDRCRDSLADVTDHPSLILDEASVVTLTLSALTGINTPPPPRLLDAQIRVCGQVQSARNTTTLTTIQ